jgi:DnaJ family protein B protein 4
MPAPAFCICAAFSLAAVLQYLAALGLPSNAALQRSQIKAAFHKAAMQWHPDKHPEPAAKATAEAKFKLVKEAYESLVMRAVA